MSFELEPELGRRRDDDASFRCEVIPEADAVRVCTVGSRDMASAPVLEQQLDELRADGCRRLIVDLAGLSFMDSNGLKVALKWRDAARHDGFEVGFAPRRPEVQRVFELTGLTERVPFIDS